MNRTLALRRAWQKNLQLWIFCSFVVWKTSPKISSQTNVCVIVGPNLKAETFEKAAGSWGLVKTWVLLTASRANFCNRYEKELLFTGF